MIGLRIRKRDGRVEKWKEKKLINALAKAFLESGEVVKDYAVLIEKIFNQCEKQKNEKNIIDVGLLHKTVETVLIGSKYKETGRKYIEYRSKRDAVRLRNSVIMKNIEGLNDESNDDIIKQNANKPTRLLCTHRDILAGITSREVAQEWMSEDVRDAHSTKIYCHDQDYGATPGLHNCGVYDYASMLDHGLDLGNVKGIETPKSIGTACNVLSQIASTISSSSYGGQSIHCYNEMLRPYAIKSLRKIVREEMTRYREIEKCVELTPEQKNIYKKNKKQHIIERFTQEIYDAQQTFLYQINTICGSNGQSAFCTISLYPSDDKICKLITEQYLLCHKNGIGKNHATPVFPKVIYFVERGNNLDKTDRNYHELVKAMECSCERMYPDYVMVDNNKKMTGASQVVTPMGCRSFVPSYIYNGNEKVTGRYNLGVCSINIMYAAAESGKDKKKFFKKLNEYCDLAYKYNMSRIDRFKVTPAYKNPILWTEGALARLQPEETIESTMYDGNATVSLGYIGVADAQEYFGDNSKEFAIEILEFLKKKCEAWYEKTRIYWSVYGTPAEMLNYTFAKAVKRDFPEINFEHDYLTNSFHKPVRAQVDIFEKLDYESDFYLYSSGGNVNNVEVPNLRDNLEALHGIISYAYDRINYLIVNQPIDQCFECHFGGEFDCTPEGFECPNCHNHNPNTTSNIRRVSGYITDPCARPMNKGKHSECQNRVKHMSV